MPRSVLLKHEVLNSMSHDIALTLEDCSHEDIETFDSLLESTQRYAFLLDRRSFLLGSATLLASTAGPVRAAPSEQIEPQPYFASVKRAMGALATAGQAIPTADVNRLAQLASKGSVEAVAAADAILDRYTLARVTLDSFGTGTTTLGGADRMLIEQGWKAFLIRIANPARLTEKLDVRAGSGTPNQIGLASFEQKADIGDSLNKSPILEKKWLIAQMHDSLVLSGALVEYRLIELFSRDRGRRRANFGFGIGIVQIRGLRTRAQWAGTLQPLFVDFDILPSRKVTLKILDSDGIGCMASLVIRDDRGHLYPPQVMRIAPDMAYQPQIYRADGETVRLPDGEYRITCWRGPEYLQGYQTVHISDSNARIAVKLERWIDPTRWGWYSGDTHLHAAGCAHYTWPTEGVSPETMIRHVRGEGLVVGNVLTWGPGWYAQKQFFSGQAVSPPAYLEHPELQAVSNIALKPKTTPKDSESILRYDVEVSGFPSSLSGHLVLLKLKEEDFPGTRVIEDWPSWNLPILKWAKAQGAVVGYAHCALGMGVTSEALPNYEIPPFDSVGTNEAIVDITHAACDFLSGCNGPPIAELNAWYHMLNCGYSPVMVGETDYPCFTPTRDSRPGVGRSYVKLRERPTGDEGYNAWVSSLKQGRIYWGDGRTHFLTFSAQGNSSGDDSVELAKASRVLVRATVAALLEEKATAETIRTASEQPWHIEHARIGSSRNVLVELVVNAVALARIELLADGNPRPVEFDVHIDRSSWIALRVMHSGHTYPVFVTVGGKPIRASRRSAQWLRKCVDALWQEKCRLIRGSEQSAAAEAYDHARLTYDHIIAESDLA